MSLTHILETSEDNSADLYQQVAEQVKIHIWFENPADSGYGKCGHQFDEWPKTSLDMSRDEYAAHLGQVVGDMLIDLAGRGELLASIDRIAR